MKDFDQIHDIILEKLDAIQAQTTKTNGRVTDLEKETISMNDANNMKDIYLILKHKDTRFTLSKPLYWWCEMDGDTLDGTIPENYRTDFASIPSLFHWFIGPYDPKVAIPAIIHDYLLDYKIYKRPFCDKIFFKKMLDFGMPLYKAYIAYICVLIYGKIKSWKHSA